MQGTSFQTPPLEWVRAFEAVARCGSFTAAAADLGLTQSAISQRITQLEQRLGTVLFLRRPRSIELTVEGEAWLPHVRTALDGLRDSSEALFGRVKKKMTISASQSIIALWLMPRLTQLQAITAGQLSLQTMVTGTHEAARDDVIRIRYGAGGWPHDYALPLYSEAIAPVAAPGLIKSSDDWTSLPRIACVGPRPGWTHWASRFDISTTPVATYQFDTFAAALSAAEAGLGVLLGSLPLCSYSLNDGRLCRLGTDLLEHHETYWALAGRDAVTRADWKLLEAALNDGRAGWA